jgi:hypothetical protein
MLEISNFKLNYKLKYKLMRVVTPFTMDFWLTLFLLYCMYLLNRYVVSNKWVNVLYIIICLVIIIF